MPFSNSPAMRTVPESTLSSPARTISKVDLPDPDGPTMPVASPPATSRLTPFSTWTEEAPSPSVSETSLNAMTASVTMKASYMVEKGDDSPSECFGHMGLAAWLSNTHSPQPSSFSLRFAAPFHRRGPRPSASSASATA
ncbi:hypothetical protein MPLB_710014 [Mesorhizobium sp. ORS 3324]|nr:hypothetical protein MPLB_710014 [Mesorhizobium sp. ORS 3324]